MKNTPDQELDWLTELAETNSVRTDIINSQAPDHRRYLAAIAAQAQLSFAAELAAGKAITEALQQSSSDLTTLVAKVTQAVQSHHVAQQMIKAYRSKNPADPAWKHLDPSGRIDSWAPLPTIPPARKN